MTRIILAFALAGLSVVAFGCSESTAPVTASGSAADAAASNGQVLLNGAGATFPNPIYSKWFSDYYRQHPQVQINYQSIGSGGGIRQMLEGTVDFGASDSPMTDEQLQQAKTKILHFPTVVGADVASYNIPQFAGRLNLSPEILSDIFLGKINKWNDPAIAKTNPGVKLPAKDIVVIHRSDGSGTTFVWTDYLSKVSPEWKAKVGASTAVNWPVGLGGKGNEGVAGLIQQTPYSMGYLELVYALQNQMSYAKIRNSAGNFVQPDLMSVTAAAAGAAQNMPADFRVSITNAPGADAYPISSFTWLLVPARIENAAKREALTGFLRWMLSDGQSMVEALSYAKLPPQVIAMEEKTIGEIH